ncbi:hypothetical protein EDC04DRAFT_1507010 [Pisolithus marmoratus]|nr:hypothetical protein EDC04DRAFT_1507010 [Pisolithus marmoratus]
MLFGFKICLWPRVIPEGLSTSLHINEPQIIQASLQLHVRTTHFTGVPASPHPPYHLSCWGPRFLLNQPYISGVHRNNFTDVWQGYSVARRQSLPWLPCMYTNTGTSGWVDTTPGSYTVAKCYGLLANPRCFSGPGIHTDPATLFELTGWKAPSLELPTRKHPRPGRTPRFSIL